MRWVVDGMNVIGSRPDGWWRDRPAAMRALTAQLGDLARSSGDELTVIFDGRPFALEGERGVTVQFARRGGPDAADDDIAALVEADEDPGGLTVVTSDGALGARVSRAGARIIGSGRVSPPARLVSGSRYRTAFLDWLACAVRGRDEPAARAAAVVGETVVAAGTAGHVLDFDDTYLPGLAHLSAPSAPAALVTGAEQGRTLGEVLAAYADGFEAMGAVARASHPALYDGHFHPTAVCGGVGAAVAAAAALELDAEQQDSAQAIALIGAAGLRAAFGSHGKSLQVGLAAGAGVRAARLAQAGARVPLASAARGFADATGGAFARPDPAEPAIAENWIKAWPCCLQTHGAIEAAAQVGEARALAVAVHPVSVQAAAYGPRPADGLQAKFSIPYVTAWTLLHGPPRVDSFESIDGRVCELAERIEVRAEPALLESECVLSADGTELARVQAALGSPGQPLSDELLAAKVADLAGSELTGALDHPERPAADLLDTLVRT